MLHYTQGPFPYRTQFFADPAKYNSSLSEEFNLVTAANVQAYMQQAIWEFELLAGNESYSGYFLVDWRINFWPLNEFVHQNLDELPREQANYFLTLHHKAADILYQRLGIE